ncbi:MAG: lipopolysaccharide heptosyltransferase I [Acidobacteria bacterium]|nr:lipopolysaccharide heptosyltransferase I [Acidobacteriota bacterium]
MTVDRLLIVRLGSLGDVVHTLPAVNLLRRALPTAEIHWAIEERWSELVKGCGESGRPLVDTLHFINTREWRRALLSHETWREVIVRFRELRAARFDAAIDFQGLLKSAMVAARSGAKVRYGFEQPRERIAALLYSHRVPITARHIVDRNLALARAVAPDARCDACFNLPRDQEAEDWCEAELQRRGIRGFVLLSPGGGWGAKLWPAEKYAEVARALGREGLPSIVNYGPGEDSLAAGIAAASERSATALRCSLAELIALARRASVFVGGDTGPMHLAAAAGIPVVALFGPTDPMRNGPYAVRNVVLRSPQSVNSYSHKAQSDPGLQSIPASAVIDAVHTLLGATA